MFKKTLMSIFILFSGLSLFSAIENNNIKFKSDNYETKASLRGTTGETKSNHEFDAGFETYLSKQIIESFGSKVPINYYSFDKEIFKIGLDDPVDYETFIETNLVDYAKSIGSDNYSGAYITIEPEYQVDDTYLMNNTNTNFYFTINDTVTKAELYISEIINSFENSSEFIDLDNISDEVWLNLSSEIEKNIGVFTSTYTEEDKNLKFSKIQKDIEPIILDTINEFVQSNLLISSVEDDQQDFSMITNTFSSSITFKFTDSTNGVSISNKHLSELTFINVESTIEINKTIFIGEFPKIESLDFWYQVPVIPNPTPISNFKWYWVVGPIAILAIIAIMIILIILGLRNMKEKELVKVGENPVDNSKTKSKKNLDKKEPLKSKKTIKKQLKNEALKEEFNFVLEENFSVDDEELQI